MRKYSVIALFVVCGVHSAFGQDPDTPFRKFGFMAGVNFSHMNFNKGVPPPPTPVATNWKPGIFFGVTLQIPVADNVSIQPQYLFSQLGGEIKNSGVDYKLNYFSMPLFLRYQFNQRIAMMAGPQFDLLINAKKDSSGKSYNITHDTEERNFGLALAAEIQLWHSLGVNIRYMHGLNHIGIGQRSDLKEFKYEVFQGGMSIRF